MQYSQEVEQWSVGELVMEGPAAGNPFVEVRLSAEFFSGVHYAYAEGFYDGKGVYRIRFMPSVPGEWTFVTSSNVPEWNGRSGTIRVAPASPGNHGPVRVKDESHFGYADGFRYRPIGTNCYLWHLGSEALREQTLTSLRRSPFNKIRMSVLPMANRYIRLEPELYPFEGSIRDGFDFDRPNPTYFARLEEAVLELQKLGIEAELILLHPCDDGRYGYNRMTREQEERYLRYVIARFGAFRNIWWCLAYEHDRMADKTPDDWERLFGILRECDAGQHLRSIQNASAEWYDYGKPWITHLSLRTHDVKLASDLTRDYNKPVVMDECGAEGNLDNDWGSLLPEDMLYNVWEGNCRGGYVTYSEAYAAGDGAPLWMYNGGSLTGRSLDGIRFLKELLDVAPENVTYASGSHDASTLFVRGEYYLQYFGAHQFLYRQFKMMEGYRYQVELIDTWNLTIKPLLELFEGKFRIDLPAKVYYALRIRKVSEGSDGIDPS